MGDREQVRRVELQAIAQAGKDAELELQKLDAEVDTPDALETHPIMVATLKAIEQFHLSDVDAERVIRAQRMTLVTTLPRRP